MPVLVRQHVLKGAVVLLEELFVALLDDESPDARRQSAGTDYVRRAEELMRARFSEAISMKEIADSLNIGLRSLQMAFRQHRALAPREILNRIRLEEVRRRLLEAEPGENVTQIAFDCGFTHLGRFSAIYRRTFGERPSDTLR
jgi:transcriptional regulator GlxA family with amidase domain